MLDQDTKTVRGWRAKVGLLLAIITPTIAATGSFYSIKLDAQDREAKMNERVATLELSTRKDFANKDDVRELHDDINQLRTEVSDIKTILIRQHR